MNLDDIYIRMATNTLTQDEPMPETKPTEERAPAERILDPEYRAKLRKSASLLNPPGTTEPPPHLAILAADLVAALDLVEALEGQIGKVEGELHQLAAEVLGEE